MIVNVLQKHKKEQDVDDAKKDGGHCLVRLT